MVMEVADVAWFSYSQQRRPQRQLPYRAEVTLYHNTGDTYKTQISFKYSPNLGCSCQVLTVGLIHPMAYTLNSLNRIHGHKSQFKQLENE